MLRIIRIFLAVLFCLGITALFLDFSGFLPKYIGWMAKVQFLPAVMATSFVIVAVILVFTLLFGRWYCSVVCPLGVMQDGFNFVARMVKKNRFHYVKENKWVRYTVLALFVLLTIVGLNGVAILVAPYSAYGRIVANLMQPLYLKINNLLAAAAERRGSYDFYTVDIWLKSGVSLAVAVATVVVVGFLALRRGRTWCNTVCPVGTVLGLMSRFAIFRPVIDADKCKNCRKCEKSCKASCIDIENHRIDYSRCVSCMDCISKCKFDALHYRNGRFTLKTDDGKVDEDKRKFLITTAVLGSTALLSAQEKKIDGGLAAVEQKQVPTRGVPLKPAGSRSLKNFSTRCTGCQLCVTECPNHVLRPSKKLDTMLQPEMSFERGFCRPECTRCSEVCPSGAIRAVTREEKSNIKIGIAILVKDRCLPYTENVKCGNCARHCPSDAIVMIPKEKGSDPGLPMTILVPQVVEEKCIGCGACEYLCPSRPFSAIYVNGYERHRE